MANVPDVTLVPYLTPAETIIAEVTQQTGLSPTQVAAALGIGPGDLVNATGLTEVQQAVAQLSNGQPPTPLTDAGFLDPTEIAQVQSTIDQYNQIIAREVTAAGGVLVDIHSLVDG